MMTQGKLKSNLMYCKDTGQFYWISNKNNGVTAGNKAGWMTEDGYWRITIEGFDYRAHQLAWLYVYGEMPKMINHINRNRSDNRICNLRKCNQSQKAINRKVAKNNKSGVPGVYWSKREGKWKAFSKANGKNISLGTFVDKKDAINARLFYCQTQHGQFYDTSTLII